MAKKNSANANLITSILYIIVGVLLAIFKDDVLSIIMTIAGVLFVISGVLELLKLNFIGGAVSILIGAAIIVLGWLVVEIVLIVLGVMIAIKGVIALLEALKGKKKILDFVYPVITIVVGILIAFGSGLDWLLLIGGIVLIVNGLIGIVGCFKK